MIKFNSYLNTHSIGNSSLDLLFKKICEEKNSNTSGHYNLPYERKAIEDSIEYINKNANLISSIKNLVIIGIGGSSLGLKAIDTMLSHSINRNNIKLSFLEHTDPIKIEKTLDNLSLANTLFIVISKSGATIETISLMKYVMDKYLLLANKGNVTHICLITDINSPLHYFGKNRGIYTITINKNIGGRFSILSSIGILPLMILGYKTEDILYGARMLSDSFFGRSEDHILKKAIFYGNNRDKFNINILFSYSSVFVDFNSWYVQLWGESLGKINNFGEKISLTPIALIGSIDQHSFLQSIVHGVMDKTITFLSLNQNKYHNPKIPNINLEFLESCDFVNGSSFASLLQKQQLSTMEAIQEEKVPTDHIEIDELNEISVGFLIMYYEILTSCTGSVLNINTYNQPGVELGKKLLVDKFKI